MCLVCDIFLGRRSPPPKSVDPLLQILRTYHSQATAIGEVTGTSEQKLGLVSLQNRIGASRLLDMLNDEQLPHVCEELLKFWLRKSQVKERNLESAIITLQTNYVWDYITDSESI